MTLPNADNVRVKRRYLGYLREARGLSEITVANAARAIFELQTFHSDRDFKRLTRADLIAFKKSLIRKHCRADGLAEKGVAYSKLQAVKRFWEWLSTQSGYMKSTKGGEAEYLNLTLRDRAILSRDEVQPSPSLEQIRAVVLRLPSESAIEKRNQALIACAVLTGARVAAIASFKLRHVIAGCGGIFQNAREVRTKFGHSYRTDFFPVGDDLVELFDQYVTFLRSELYFGDDDPLFPATAKTFGREPPHLSRQHWKTTEPIREIYRKAFAFAGVPYFHPHSFRRTLTLHGMRICRTPEDVRAWSMNLGHRQLETTFYSYGRIPEAQKSEVLRRLSEARVRRRVPDAVRQMMETMINEMDDETWGDHRAR